MVQYAQNGNEEELETEFECRKIERLKEVEENRKKLDIYYQKDEIIQTIKNHSVILIEGATGSGKTTQIPQFLVEEGFASRMIAITQPRRISAISTSSRINFEMNQSVSGYKIMYDNNVTAENLIQVMTEGILLKEIQEDFLLLNYSVIILDEIHERSLNIDILIGLLSKIVKLRQKRKNYLKILLMSATMDVSTLKNIFNTIGTVKVEGKQHKVSVFYEDETPINYLEVVYNKIISILKLKNALSGSILVFLPGKEDIYRLKDKLEETFLDITILPLHSNLYRKDQEKVFKKYKYRKIILSTNIAETSITIDDISYVIDTGRVKIKKSDQLVTNYETQFISKSNAIQRMGRAGRTQLGVCFRIYSGKLYEGFDEFNTPQIYLESFHSALFSLLSLGITKIEKFPFINVPEKLQIKTAYQFLKTNGFITEKNSVDLQFIRDCSRIPLSCEFARNLILLYKEKNSYLIDFCVIFAMISVGCEIKRTKENEMYLLAYKSDFLVYLAIFKDFLIAKNKKEYCRKHGLSLSIITEAGKLIRYSYKLVTGNDFNNAFNIEREFDEVEFINCVAFLYKKQIAVKSGDEYLYYGKSYLICKDSVNIGDAEFIAFEHIQIANNKMFLKNITKLNGKNYL
ncbi:hypothetical protein NUSPORA_01104 [Nucleospora cyclopteri]